jgi:hypothetical protein
MKNVRAIQFVIPPDGSVSATTKNFMHMVAPSPEPTTEEIVAPCPVPIITEEMGSLPIGSSATAATKTKFLKKARKRLIAGFVRSSDSKASPTKSTLSMVPKISMVPKKAATEYRSLTPTAAKTATMTKPSNASQPPLGRNFSPPIRSRSLTGTSGTQSYHSSTGIVDSTYPTDSSGDQPKRSSHLRRPSLDPGPFHQSSPRICSFSSANATTIPVQHERDRSPNRDRSSDSSGDQPMRSSNLRRPSLDPGPVHQSSPRKSSVSSANATTIRGQHQRDQSPNRDRSSYYSGDQPQQSSKLRRPSLDPGPVHQSSPRISSFSSANATTTTIPVQRERARSPNRGRPSDCSSAASDASPPLRDRVNLRRQTKVFRNPNDQPGFQNE